MDIVLIRHPRLTLPDGICYGRSDIALSMPLTPSPEAIAARIDGGAPQRIVTSPAARCRMLADALAHLSGGTRVEPEPRLTELDFGAWEMQAWDDIPRADIDAWAADVMHACPHGGETAAAMWRRVIDWALQLRGERLWVVTHAGVMRMLAAHWLHLPMRQTMTWPLGWGGVSGFRVVPGGPATLLYWNR
jgi:alpha-ribazole phosphatase